MRKYVTRWKPEDGKSKTIKHDLGTTDVMVFVHDLTGGSVLIDVTCRVDANIVSMCNWRGPVESPWYVTVASIEQEIEEKQDSECECVFCTAAESPARDSLRKALKRDAEYWAQITEKGARQKPKTKCECGAKAANVKWHSDWCPEFKEYK